MRDKVTGRRVYHLHSLRKFFRTKIGLDLDVTHALMGHTEYLDDAYLRLEEEGEIAKAYLEAMPNVSVYQVEDHELREQASVIEQENVKLKGRMAKMESKLVEMERIKNVLNLLDDPVILEALQELKKRAETGGKKVSESLSDIHRKAEKWQKRIEA